MIAVLENQKYSYHKKTITVSADVVIYADTAKTVELHRYGISSTTNLDTTLNAAGVPRFKAILLSDLTNKAQTVINDFVNVMQAINLAYPTATTPQDALNAFCSDVEAKLTVPTT